MVQSPKEYRLVRLELPVPPQFERHCGYPGAKRYVAFYWSRDGSEIRYEDGVSSGTGEPWPWGLFLSYPAVQKALFPFQLGASETEATHWLLLSRQNRTLWIGHRDDVQAFLRDAQPVSRPDDQRFLIEAQNFRDSQRIMRDKLQKDRNGSAFLEEGSRPYDFLKAWLDRNMPGPKAGRR